MRLKSQHVRFGGGFEYFAYIGARICFQQTMIHAVAHDLVDMAAKAVKGIKNAGCFHWAQYLDHLGGADLVNGHLADKGQHIHFKHAPIFLGCLGLYPMAL